MSVLDRLENKGTNSGWLGETLERARQQREAEEAETQRQRLQNQADQAANPDFIGPNPKWYVDAVNKTKRARKVSETLAQGKGPLVQKFETPSSKFLKPLENPLEVYRDESVYQSPLVKKYGIDPYNFGMRELEDWADNHNMEVFYNNGNPAITIEPKTTGGFLGIGAKPLATEEEQEDAQDLLKLAMGKTNYEAHGYGKGDTLYSHMDSISSGLVNGASFGLADWAIRNAQTKGEEKEKLDALIPKEYQSYAYNPIRAAQEVHPDLYAGADLTGSLASTFAGGNLIGNALKGAFGAAKYALYLERALGQGLTFGARQGLMAATGQPTDDEWREMQEQEKELRATFGQEYTPRPLTMLDRAKNVGLNTAAGFIGGAAGGLLGDMIGIKSAQLLSKYGLQTIPMEIARQGAIGVTNAAASMLPSYFMLPEEQRPTGKQIAQNAAIQGIFSILTGSIQAIRTTQANKAYLNRSVQQIQKDLQEMTSGRMTGDQAVAAAQNVKQYNQNIRNAIKQNYYAGNQKYVNQIQEALDAVDEQVDLILGRNTKTGNVVSAKNGSAVPVSAQGTGIGTMEPAKNIVGSKQPVSKNTTVPLQQPQNRGTINQTEVALDGQRAKETMGRYVDQTAGRGNVGRNDARGTGSYGTASQAGSAASGEYDAGRTESGFESVREETVGRGQKSGAGKDTWTTKTGKQLTYQPVQETQLGQVQHEARSRANERGFYTVYFDGELDAYNADGTLFRRVDDGTVDGNAIFVRRDSEYPASNVVDHESVHGIKRLQPESYETLRNTVQNAIYPVEFSTEVENFTDQVVEAYGGNIDDALAYELALEETLANLSYQINEDTPPSYVADVDAVKQAYDVFFHSLGTKVSQQGSTQQAAGMDTGTGDVRGERVTENGGVRAIEPYTQHEIDNFNSGKILIDGVNEKLSDFIDKSLSGNDNGFKRLYLGKINPTLAAYIKQSTGVDVENYNVAISNDSIRKIIKKHGGVDTEKLRGQVPVTSDLIAKLPEVITHPDKILPAGKTKQGKSAIMFAKEIGDRIFAVEYVSDKHKTLDLQTLYAIKGKKNKPATEFDAQAPQTSETSETTRGTAINDSIPRDAEKINRNNENVKSDKWGSDPSRWTAEKMKGTTDESVRSLGEISRFVEQAFGIPVSTGNIDNIQNGNARGIFKNRSEAVRTRVANAIPTISHELGHYLDKKFKLSKLKSIDEAMRGMDEQFAAQYSDAELPGEAVAEFLREYLSNREAAAEKYPTFYQEFLSKLDEQTASKLETLSNMVNRYLSSTAVSRAQSAIKTGKEAQKIESTWQARQSWVEERLSGIYQKMVDGNYAIERMTKEVEGTTGKKLRGKNNPYQLATNAANAEARAAYIINTAMTDADGNIISDKSLLKALEPITKENQKDFSTYLVARHAPEWLRPDADGKTKRVFADDTINTPEAAMQIAAELEKEHPEFQQAAEDLYEYQKAVMQYWLVDTGMMSKETFDALQEKYPNYVPFYRVTKEPGRLGRAKSGFANQNTPIKRAKGSGLEIQDPIESIVYNTVRFVKAATRNQVMQVLSDYANSVDGLGYFMERVPPDMAVKLVHTDQAKSKILNALDGMEGMNDDIAKAIDTALGDHIAEFTPVANQDKGIVTVLRNGKKEYYQVHDRQLLESLASLSPEKLKGIYKISNMFMSPIKALITGANPFFSIGSNIWRDLRTAYINGSKENPVSFLGDYVKAYIDMARNTTEYQQFRAMGGGSVSHITAERDLMKKILKDVQHRNDNAAQWIFRNVINPIRAIQNLGDAVESSGRFAEFKRQLKAGEDTYKSIYEANDITTNFNRYGTSGRKYNALLMYGNAAVQGIDRLARNFTKGWKTSAKTALKVLLPSLAMIALQKFWNRDDEEEYQNLSAYQKNNYYNFSIGDGKFIRIPKAQLADVPGSAMERFYETAFEGDENAFYDFGEYLFGQLFIPGIPTNLSSPGSIVQDVLGDTVIGPFVDTAANLDFKGSPIESAAMQELPPTMRYDGRTSWAAYYLGQVLNMSPKQIDHIINSSTGVIGRLNKAVGTMEGSQRDWTFGLKNQFVSDSVYSTDTLNRFYDEAQQANYDHQLEPDNPQAASKNAAYEAQRMYISQYNKAANGTKLEPAGQRAARKNLQDTVNAFDPSNMKYKDELEEIYSDTHDDKIFMTTAESKLEKTENKVKKECQLTPAEYTQMMKDMRQAVEKAYGKILNSNKSSAEKAELLKEAKSDAMSDVRAQYKKKYALRFKEVGK